MMNKVWMNRIQMNRILPAVKTAALGVVMTAVAAGTVSAQSIVFTGEAAPLTVYQSYTEAAQDEEASVQTIEAAGLEVLGTVSAGEDTDLYAVVLLPKEDAAEDGTTWNAGFVLASQLMETVPALSLEDLPSFTGWTDLGGGASGELVIDAQNDLIGLGILSGTADGQYGSGTAGAVAAFQQENGLPATGILDVFTFFCMEEKAAGTAEAMEVPYPPVYTAEDKFDDILDDVEDASVLETFVTPEWRYTFDAFEGEGLITDGTVIGTFEDSSRPVDMISLSVSPVMKVKREDTGLVSVHPVLQVQSIGAYRPYVQSIILKAGNDVCELGDAVRSGKLVGTQVEEVAEIPVSPEDLKGLENSADKDLEIRVKGNNKAYDLAVSTGVQELTDLIGKMN